jgi:hypothetical protein
VLHVNDGCGQALRVGSLRHEQPVRDALSALGPDARKPLKLLEKTLYG